MHVGLGAGVAERLLKFPEPSDARHADDLPLLPAPDTMDGEQQVEGGTRQALEGGLDRRGGLVGHVSVIQRVIGRWE